MEGVCAGEELLILGGDKDPVIATTYTAKPAADAGLAMSMFDELVQQNQSK
jgi:hypothetical protein